jgi:hypothetical protein
LTGTGYFCKYLLGYSTFSRGAAAPSAPLLPTAMHAAIGLNMVGLNKVGLHMLGLHMLGLHMMGLHMMGLHMMGLRMMLHLLVVCSAEQKSW